MQEPSQLLKFDGFGQMIIEAGFQAAADIFLHPEAAQRDPLHRLTTLRLAHEFVATGVRQADVADERIKSLRLHQLERALPGIRREDFVSAFAKKP